MGEAPVYAAQIAELGEDVFRCQADGCRRFFDSEQGMKLHTAKTHPKGGD